MSYPKEDYITELNDKLHHQGYEPYELVKDIHGMVTAEKIADDSIRLTSGVNDLGLGYLQIINAIPVRFFKMEEIVLVKKEV